MTSDNDPPIEYQINFTDACMTNSIRPLDFIPVIVYEQDGYGFEYMEEVTANVDQVSYDKGVSEYCGTIAFVSAIINSSTILTEQSIRFEPSPTPGMIDVFVQPLDATITGTEIWDVTVELTDPGGAAPPIQVVQQLEVEYRIPCPLNPTTVNFDFDMPAQWVYNPTLGSAICMSLPNLTLDPPCYTIVGA